MGKRTPDCAAVHGRLRGHGSTGGFCGNPQTKPSGAPPFQSESTGQGADVPLRDGAPLGAPGGAPTSESIAQLGGWGNGQRPRRGGLWRANHKRSRQHPPTGERRALTGASEGVSAPEESIAGGAGEVNKEAL